MREEILSFMISLAKKAGEIQMDNYGKSYSTEWKRQHMRTQIDKEIAIMVREEIHKRFPSFAIMTEELPEKRGREDRVFVADEMDGTNPYFRQFSDHFAFSIGLCEGTTPIAGVVYAPLRKELYVGSEKGAFCNGEPIRVSRTQEINKVWMSFVSGKSNRANHIPYLKRAMAEDGISGTVNFGCASVTLCLVGSGRLDAFLATSLEPEDMAAAVPILRGAGTKVTNLSGKEWQLGDKSILAANSELHQKLFNFLQTR